LGRLLAISLVAAVLLTGCSKSHKTVDDSNDTAVLKQPESVAEYLRGRELAELMAVERWRYGLSDGMKLITAHYEICTTLLDPLILRQLPGFMEAAYRAYNSQLPEPIETSRKSKIYLFADRKQWESFTMNFAGEQARLYCAIEAGAYCHNGLCVAYNIGRTRTFSALAHEGWHQFSARHFKYRLPSWLDEGVAMLFEEYQREGGEFRFAPECNSYRIDALKRTVKSRQMLPLVDLLSINPGEILATDQNEAVRSLYSQSYALVRFLREASDGERLVSYQKMLADAATGDWPIDETSKEIARDRNKPRTVLWNSIVGINLFTSYIGSDIEQLQLEYLAFCKQIALSGNSGSKD